MMNVRPTIFSALGQVLPKEDTAEVVTDIAGVILSANDVFARMIGRHVTILVHTRLAVLFENACEYEGIGDAVLKSGSAQDCVSVLCTINNGRITTLTRANKLIRNGREFLLWQFTDVSDHRETARKLAASRKEVQRLSSQIERFLYSTSHDLRAPLTTILGLVNLMRLDQPASELQDWMNKIESSALRLEKIVSDIGSFSRTTYQPREIASFYLKPLVATILESFQSHENFTLVKMEIYVDDSMKLRSDANRLKVVLHSLIRNAFDYVDTSKSAPYLRISARKEGLITEIEILENGIGIAKEYQSKIFDLFYKASSNSKGAGLGLFMAAETLSQINGNIALESEIGFGTAVHVRIPDLISDELTSISFRL